MVNFFTVIDKFHFLLLVYWTVYCLVHSLFASVTIKNWIAKISGAYYKYYRLLYSIFAAATLAWLFVFQFTHHSSQVFRPSLIIMLVSIPMAVLGVIIMMACILKYFVNLSGVDVFLKQRPKAGLETKGLHRYVRHPLYAGTLLFIWSLFFMFPLLSNLIACLVITVYTFIGIKMEEQKLLREYGDDYKIYSSNIPMLLPTFRRKGAR